MLPPIIPSPIITTDLSGTGASGEAVVAATAGED